MLRGFLDAWTDPAMRHAMIVHFPVVLSIVGIPVAVAAALVKDRARSMRWTALACFVVLAVSGLMASLAGERAHDAIPGLLGEEARAILHDHEEMGEKVWPLAALACALVGVSFVPRARVQRAASWLAVAAALFIAVWVGTTASLGGRLVYEHGAGTDVAIEVLPVQDPVSAADADARMTFFREQVRPIFATICCRCHNPAKDRLPGKLDLTAIAGLLEGGVSGPAIVPGRPEESLLIRAVRGTDPDFVMPPGDGKELAEIQIAALERWIAEGAVWEPFALQLPEGGSPAPEPGGASGPPR
jgi:uncharacterized membrane protein